MTNRMVCFEGKYVLKKGDLFEKEIEESDEKEYYIPSYNYKSYFILQDLIDKRDPVVYVWVKKIYTSMKKRSDLTSVCLMKNNKEVWTKKLDAEVYSECYSFDKGVFLLLSKAGQIKEKSHLISLSFDGDILFEKKFSTQKEESPNQLILYNPSFYIQGNDNKVDYFPTGDFYKDVDEILDVNPRKHDASYCRTLSSHPYTEIDTETNMEEHFSKLKFKKLKKNFFYWHRGLNKHHSPENLIFWQPRASSRAELGLNESDVLLEDCIILKTYINGVVKLSLLSLNDFSEKTLIKLNSEEIGILKEGLSFREIELAITDPSVILKDNNKNIIFLRIEYNYKYQDRYNWIKVVVKDNKLVLVDCELNPELIEYFKYSKPVIYSSLPEDSGFRIKPLEFSHVNFSNKDEILDFFSKHESEIKTEEVSVNYVGVGYKSSESKFIVEYKNEKLFLEDCVVTMAKEKRLLVARSVLETKGNLINIFKLADDKEISLSLFREHKELIENIRKIPKGIREFISTHSIGIPDLFSYDAKNEKFMFIEIKSQNDNLSLVQKCWFNEFTKLNSKIEYVLFKVKSSTKIPEIQETIIKGVQFRKIKIEELDKIKIGDNLTLIHESGNRYDPSAIRIFHNKLCLGYVPKGFADKERLIESIKKNKYGVQVTQKYSATVLKDYRIFVKIYFLD
ncbi:MAG: VRR-NUC domain-containing protein [Nanoarchaeota archaeon]|nr:VRR-NUC domain-containing protein [Nanoarchaeota archaeon]